MAEGIAWGDIRLVDLGGRAGQRPALILTRTAVIPYLNAITVAPITRTIRGAQTELTVGVNEGLKAESVAQFDSLLTIPVDSIGRFVGSLSPRRKAEVAERVLYAFELSEMNEH